MRMLVKRSEVKIGENFAPPEDGPERLTCTAMKKNDWMSLPIGRLPNYSEKTHSLGAVTPDTMVWVDRPETLEMIARQLVYLWESLAIDTGKSVAEYQKAYETAQDFKARIARAAQLN